MLDTKQSWDNLVRRHAPDAATAARILENPLYQNISGRFVQSHEYIAMERLYELHSEGNYDLIVVDTPPTRNALDFIEAPERMAEFFSSRLLRLLIVPYRVPLVNLASRPFYQVADRILGSQFLQDIAEFFILFQTMYDGFVERAQAVAAAAARQAHHLRGGDHPGGGAGPRGRVLHRGADGQEVPPRRPGAQQGAARLPQRRGRRGAGRVLLADRAPSWRPRSAGGHRCSDPAQVERVLTEVGESFRNFGVVAQREAAQRAELAAAPDVVASVPYFETDIYDLDGSASIGRAVLDLVESDRRVTTLMATMAELARDYTDLDGPTLSHLQRLVASWGMLSDLCFADLLLFVPVSSSADRFVVLGQVRPTTSPDPAPRGPGRPRHRRGRAAPGLAVLAAGQHRRGRGRHPEPQRAGPAGVHPGALAGQGGGGHDPGVGAVGRPPSRRAGAGLRRGLRPLRPHDRGRGVPLPGRRAGHERGCPGRRRRAAARCDRPGRVRLAQRRQRPAPHGHVLRPRGHAPRRGGHRRDGGGPGVRHRACR